MKRKATSTRRRPFPFTDAPGATDSIGQSIRECNLGAWGTECRRTTTRWDGDGADLRVVVMEAYLREHFVSRPCHSSISIISSRRWVV